jgi:ribosomal protein S13
MDNKVYYLHSTIEILLEQVEKYMEGLESPEGIDGVEIKRRSNTLMITAVADGSGLGKYTPTAVIKGTVTEKKVLKELSEEEIEALDPDEERPVDIFEIATFKGELDAILQNTVYQYQMFEIFCGMATAESRGTLEAISIVDEKLESIKIIDGEIKACGREIVEDAKDASVETGVSWRDNKYIN